MHLKKYTSHMTLVCQAIRRKIICRKRQTSFKRKATILSLRSIKVNKKIIRYNNNSGNRKQVNNNERRDGYVLLP